MIRARPPVAADRAALAGLLAQMLAHYGQRAPAERLSGAIDRLLSPAPGGPAALVADAGGRLVGFAVFAATFPAADLADGLFLRDIYVSAEARGLGAGQVLLRAVAGVAQAQGHDRLEWLTGPDNDAARRLYAAVGAEPEPALRYRVEGEALARMAAG